jgi:hypothetical protein
MYDYAGAFHIHTDYSFDGNTDIKSVIASARRAGLNFIVVTDHFRLDAKNDGYEGWHDGLFTLIGEEISPRFSHYLALGIDKAVVAWQKRSRPQEYIDAVSAQGGFGLIAHPDHTGAPKFGVKEYSWKDWNISGYSGISVWDLMTDWQEKLTSPFAAVIAYLFPTEVLTGPKKETLERWDELNKAKSVPGFGEIDNHNSRKRFYGLNFWIFPFDYAFRTIRTHILLDEPLSGIKEGAKNQIHEAIKAGRMYIAQEYWKSAKGFVFRIFDSEAEAVCGCEFRLSGKPAALEAKIPGDGAIRLIFNGKLVAESQKRYIQFDVDKPGIYRVEVLQKQLGKFRPWIYSNHIRVTV